MNSRGAQGIHPQGRLWRGLRRLRRPGGRRARGLKRTPDLPIDIYMIIVDMYIYIYIHTYMYIYIYMDMVRRLAFPALPAPQWYGLKGGRGGPGTHGVLSAPASTLTSTLKPYRTQSPGLKLVCCSIIWQTIAYYSIP